MAANQYSSTSRASHAKLSNRDKKAWVDPDALPNADYTTLEFPNVEEIAGNAPLHAKRLALNTFAAYGVGESEAFGHAAGRKVRFVSIDVDFDDGRGRGGERYESSVDLNKRERSSRDRDEARRERGRREGGRTDGDGSNSRASVSSATAVAELVVDKSMVNGNGMMHGGCLTYLIDNCAGMPLVVLGVLRGINGVGVTQAMNVLFHAPAPLGSTLEIVSTSLALGGRSMTAKCEIFDKTFGRRLVASAFINKMQPKL